MESIFLDYLIFWKWLGYILVFLLLLIEGEAVLFLAAFLTRQGFFDFWDMLIVALFSIILGDILWYFLGRSRFMRTSLLVQAQKWVDRITTPFVSHIKNRPLHTLTFSRFVYGFHRAVLIKTATLGVPFSKFLKADIVASLFWTAVIGGLGYGTGASLYALRHYLRVTEISLLVGVIVFIIAQHFIAKYSRKVL